MAVGQKRVPVTYEHINDGVRCDCELCGLAVALRDAGFRGITVGDIEIRVGGVSFECSPAVGQWVNLYDETDNRNEVTEEVLVLDYNLGYASFEREEA